MSKNLQFPTHYYTIRTKHEIPCINYLNYCKTIKFAFHVAKRNFEQMTQVLAHNRYL